MAWTTGPTIGRGSTAAVFLATTPSGDFFAVKSADHSASALLQKEEYLISQLCSPYIVKCFGSDVTREDDKHVYNLFLEYLPGGTVSDLIRKQGNSLDEGVIRGHANQVLLGLSCIHRKGMVHCDIKGQNILVGDGGLKIGDFGCARWAGSGGVAASAFAGTPAYMAPEVARGEEQSFPSDVWAFGCLIIEMATGCHPWPEMKDPASALYRIAFSGDVPESPSWFSDEAKDFLCKCLMRDPEERWTADELLQHPFLGSVEENCGEIVGFARRSPTSVTAQGFWDALEAPDSSRNPTETSSSSDSPAERISDLIVDGSQTSFNFPDEEDWLTVRANEIEPSQAGHHGVNTDDVIVAESAIEEELEQILQFQLMEDSFLHSFNGDDACTFPVIHSPTVKEFLYSELSFLQNMLMELFLHQDPILLIIWFLFE